MTALVGTLTTASGQTATVTAQVAVSAPAQRVRYGTTAGSQGAAKSVSDLPKCQVLRSYAPAVTKVAADSDLVLAKSKGLEVWYVFAAMPTQATFQSCVADWVASGLTFWWTFNNEADRDGNPAGYVANYNQLQAWAEAVPGYAASKVRDQTGFTAYMLTAAHPSGDPESWMPARPTRLGFDFYTHATGILAMQFAQAHKLPWVAPEFGAGGAGGEGGTGDDAALTWTRASVANWAPYPPAGACWYASTQGTNARSNTLAALPKTAAYLSSLIP